MQWAHNQLENTLRNREDNLNALENRLNNLQKMYDDEHQKALNYERQLS